MSTTWSLVNIASGNTHHDATRYDFAPTDEAPEGFLWSYFAQYRMYNNYFPASVKFTHDTASGSATPGNSNQVQFRIQGKKPADVKVVISRLEEEIGVKVLNPRLYLPEDLKSPLERIKYLVKWALTRKN